MEWVLKGYFALLSAYVCWNVLSGLFEDELPGFSDMALYVLYAFFILAAGKYVNPGLAEQMGNWSLVVTVAATIGILFWAVVSYGTLLPNSDSDEEDTAGKVSDDDEQDLDLDGDEPLPEDRMVERGAKIGKLFSPASSTSEKLEALATMGDMSEEEDDTPLETSDKVVILLGLALFVPAVVLNYLA